MEHRRRLRSGIAALAALFFLPVVACATETRDLDARIAAHLGSLRQQLDPRVVEALDRIDGLGRRLLAARSYLRARSSIAERWSWSQQQIDRYAGSPLQRALDAEIAQVRAVFEAENPGYTLWVNPQVRSVEQQIERWNDNASVAAAADSMLATLRSRVVAADAPPIGTRAARDWFAEALRTAAPDPTPTLAAPGLSRHGRMQAVDFQVQRGDRIIAGTSRNDVERVWEAQGWCERLVFAVRTASNRFEGPLVNPNEPWHYEYRPETGVVASLQAAPAVSAPRTVTASGNRTPWPCRSPWESTRRSLCLRHGPVRTWPG
ncbi:MAG TPA: hypothetical protein VFI92_13610 [Steroidobacteraceae bacterium]|nr:hypothetical protein [Steroidobacteraceae bacterium]